MNMLRNQEIDEAIKDVFDAFQVIDYNDEIHCEIYTEVLIAISNKKIDNLYGYAKTVTTGLLKKMLLEKVKKSHRY